MFELKYRKLDDMWFVLEEDFHYVTTLRLVYGNNPAMDKMVMLTGLLPDEPFVLTAPKGFVTDLASIPKPIQLLFSPEGKYGAAACMHDLLYQKLSSRAYYKPDEFGALSLHSDKEFADLLFLRMMTDYGVDDVTKSLFYNAVNAFGWPSYVDDNSTCKYTKPTHDTYVFSHNYEFFRGEITSGVPEEDIGKSNNRNMNVRYLNIKRAFIGGIYVSD